MRHSELLALRWVRPGFLCGDVDLDAGIIHVRETLSTAKIKGDSNPKKFQFFDPKTKKGKRDIPIGAVLVNALKAWKEKCPKSRLDLVFPTEVGEPSHRTNILRYGLYPALKQAGIEKEINMHGLRHTYASLLLMLGRKITDVSAYMGHGDIYVTLKVYGHFIKSDKKQDTMDDLDSAIQNARFEYGTNMARFDLHRRFVVAK